MQLFITELFKQPAFYISTVVSYAGSICVHEFCHAFVAHRLGDNTAQKGGFMTLNPLKVMGWMSIVALLVFGFSWGAVPVKRNDPKRLRRSAISLAGPLSNLALLGIFALLLKGVYGVAPVVAPSGVGYYCRLFLLCALYADAVLFLFNILPIPVLDGWGTIEPFLPKFMIPSDEHKGTIFRTFIYIICFTSASGLFDKALEMFASKFLPNQVNAISIVTEGEKCLEKEDYVGAYNAFSKAAEQGSPDGKVYLALCLAEGYGCDANPEKAFNMFSENDVCGFPMAKFYLGIMLMHGLGCTQDYNKAHNYLSQKDVYTAFPIARANLGILLAEGLGIKAEPQSAYSLFNDEEVLKLSPSARFYMAAFLMEGKVCKKDERRALALMNDQEVLNTLPQARYLLGIWYYTGTGTKQDFAKAAANLKAAADAGEPNAAQFLGYKNGRMPDYGIPLEELLRRLWNQNK